MSVHVTVTRGGRAESVHVVHLAVVDADGRTLADAGDPARSVFLRSVAKPFQALPLVEDGVQDRYGVTEAELALCCASHSGEPEHVAGAASILARVGVDEARLACGPHEPFAPRAAERLKRAGERPRSIHNNCSGKHAGMLGLARFHGWSLDGYHRAGHPVQERMTAEVARWTGVPADGMATGIDGCGVVTFAVPLRAVAGAFARLGAAAAGGEPGAGAVVGAMTRHPFMVAGTGRLCTDLMEATAGAVLAKTGAEGVYCAAVPGRGLGLALKVEDGARRAQDPALVAVLEALGVLDVRALEALSRHRSPPVENTLGEQVGEVRVDVRLGLREGAA